LGSGQSLAGRQAGDHGHARGATTADRAHTGHASRRLGRLRARQGAAGVYRGAHLGKLFLAGLSDGAVHAGVLPGVSARGEFRDHSGSAGCFGHAYGHRARAVAAFGRDLYALCPARSSGLAGAQRSRRAGRGVGASFRRRRARSPHSHALGRVGCVLRARARPATIAVFSGIDRAAARPGPGRDLRQPASGGGGLRWKPPAGRSNIIIDGTPGFTTARAGAFFLAGRGWCGCLPSFYRHRRRRSWKWGAGPGIT